MSRVAAARRVVAILLLALWWGGFSFFAGRVVFIGHQVLKSKIRQGFITERVTTELNWLVVATLVVVGWELMASEGRETTNGLRLSPTWWSVFGIPPAKFHPSLSGLVVPVPAML